MAGPVYVGSVKSFNPEKGWGHIECAETFQMYNKDIFLLRSQLQGAMLVNHGAQVSFKIIDNGRGPEAVDVTIIDPSTAAPVPKTAKPTHAGAHHKGFGGYQGVIKSFNPASGWGHITCPHTEAIYGKDIFFMKSQVPGGSISKGTSVTFSVVDGLKGPEANDITPIGGAVVSSPPQQLGALSQLAGVFPSWNGVPSNPFYGSVKSFNEDKGWGHITCSQTQSMYGKDMFVMRSALNGNTIKPGDSVQFHVIQGVKGPEASNVKVVSHAGTEATYVGTIKQFIEEKGWGFIFCEETNALYGKDIFVHKNNLQGHVPTEGESVLCRWPWDIHGPAPPRSGQGAHANVRPAFTEHEEVKGLLGDPGAMVPKSDEAEAQDEAKERRAPQNPAVLRAAAEIVKRKKAEAIDKEDYEAAARFHRKLQELEVQMSAMDGSSAAEAPAGNAAAAASDAAAASAPAAEERRGSVKPRSLLATPNPFRTVELLQQSGYSRLQAYVLLGLLYVAVFALEMLLVYVGWQLMGRSSGSGDDSAEEAFDEF